MSETFSEAGQPRKVLNAGEDDGGRLDAWLAAQVDGELSRSRIKALIEEGAVTVAGQSVTEPKRKVKPGDEIAIVVPPAEDPEPSWHPPPHLRQTSARRDAIASRAPGRGADGQAHAFRLRRRAWQWLRKRPNPA